MAVDAALAMVPTLSRRHRPATMRGVVAILIAFAGLSLGSTMAKSSGSPGPVVAFWRFLIGAAIWHLFIAIRARAAARPAPSARGAWRAATLPESRSGSISRVSSPASPTHRSPMPSSSTR